MSIKYDKYIPLYGYLSPASIPQIVAHIQDYLVKNPILSVETIAEIIVQSLQEHPELINGEAIPISPDSEQSIKAYIDSLPSIDTYTKAEINLLLTGKQDTLTFDQAPTPGSSNPVTSSGIIAAMSAMNEALETMINSKADSASTYTKTQVDTLLTDKANTDDVYSKNTMDAKLLEYAKSDSVYSKTDINTMKQINKANLAIVSSDGTAPLDISAGQYVYMDDVMFMATEAILTGAQLVPNANIVINPIGVTNRIGDGLKNAVTQINGLAETVSSQSQQIDEKADIPVTVKVTVDVNGASMTAADAAKLTADMVMCWYSGDRLKLTSNLSIIPGVGTATVTGTAKSSTTFTIAFIHSSNANSVASVITHDSPTAVNITTIENCFVVRNSLMVYPNGLVFGQLTLRCDNSILQPNVWKHVATISPAPTTRIEVAFFNGQNGEYGGFAEINALGELIIYTKLSATTIAPGFSVTYYTQQ